MGVIMAELDYVIVGQNRIILNMDIIHTVKDLQHVIVLVTCFVELSLGQPTEVSRGWLTSI